MKATIISKVSARFWNFWKRATIAASAKDDETSSHGDTPRIFTIGVVLSQQEQLESLLKIGFRVPLINTHQSEVETRN